MIILDQSFKQRVYSEAESSQRLRSHFCLHKSHQEPVQRLIIAMLKNSYIPPHKHEFADQWEYFHVIEGMIKLITFSEYGQVDKVLFLGPEADTFAVQIPPNVIHTLICLSSRAMILELKQGPFMDFQAKSFPSWSVMEDCPSVPETVNRLENIQEGEFFT